MKLIKPDEIDEYFDFERTHVQVGNQWLAVDEAARRFGLAPIIRRFGTWAVTECGVECLAHPYVIERSRLWQCNGRTWEDHVGPKEWVCFYDFWRALTFARSLFIECRPTSNVKLRFQILKRDGYRCQLCGRSAQDGISLEVDHRMPRAQGGSNDSDNLWTLCWECNRGKGSDLL